MQRSYSGNVSNGPPRLGGDNCWLRQLRPTMNNSMSNCNDFRLSFSYRRWAGAQAAKHFLNRTVAISGFGLLTDCLTLRVPNGQAFVVAIPIQLAFPQRGDRIGGRIRLDIEQCALLAAGAGIQDEDLHRLAWSACTGEDAPPQPPCWRRGRPRPCTLAIPSKQA